MWQWLKCALKVEGISLYNNVAFNGESNNICVWRSYNIGVGKDVEIESGFQGLTHLTIVRPFSESEPAIAKGTVKTAGTSSTSSTNSIYYCEQQGCIQTFQTYAEMQHHMDGCGKHKTETEKETEYDRIRKKWAEKVQHLQRDREVHTEASTSTAPLQSLEQSSRMGPKNNKEAAANDRICQGIFGCNLSFKNANDIKF